MSTPVNIRDLPIKNKRELLADLLGARADTPCIVPASLAQQRLWLLAQIQPDTATYNLSVGLRLRGTLRVEGLHHSLQAITDRHESLRTTFDLRDGQLVQVIAPPANVVVATT